MRDGWLFHKNRGWHYGTHHFCPMRATTLAFLLLPFPGAAQGVLINEVAPGEQDGPDWVELHNSGRRSVDLNGATFVSRLEPSPRTFELNDPPAKAGFPRPKEEFCHAPRRTHGCD